MKEIIQRFEVPFTYKVIFTQDLFNPKNNSFAEFFASKNELSKIYFVIDDGVLEAWPNLLQEIELYFKAYKNELILLGEPLSVPGGEAAKNDNKHLERILKATEEFHIDRHSYIVAIGGGAVLDMVGFAAAIAHRGIRHVRIPTTVLSQNDSGIGVKNGINAFGKKNYLGSFAPPFAVFNDSLYLKTLDDRDWRSGISEAIKVALIKDLAFFEEIEAQCDMLAERDLPAMESLIYKCAELHMEHIANGDPFEMGSSRPLDFGHWAAHKMEQLSDYKLRHGEAVAIGICLDVVYSFHKGMISKVDLNRVINLFKNLGFKLHHPVVSQRNTENELKIIAGLNEFREHLGGELTIMLLEDLGKGVEVHEMEAAIIEKSVAYLENMYVTV